MSRYLTILAVVLLVGSFGWNVYAVSFLPDGWTTTEITFAVCSACPALAAALFFLMGSSVSVRDWIRERPRLALLVAFAFGHVLWPHKAEWPKPETPKVVAKIKKY